MVPQFRPVQAYAMFDSATISRSTVKTPRPVARRAPRPSCRVLCLAHICRALGTPAHFGARRSARERPRSDAQLGGLGITAASDNTAAVCGPPLVFRIDRILYNLQSRCTRPGTAYYKNHNSASHYNVQKMHQVNIYPLRLYPLTRVYHIASICPSRAIRCSMPVARPSFIWIVHSRKCYYS